jgi:hypothetical protein
MAHHRKRKFVPLSRQLALRFDSERARGDRQCTPVNDGIQNRDNLKVQFRRELTVRGLKRVLQQYVLF